jgi:hypothetical protein
MKKIIMLVQIIFTFATALSAQNEIATIKNDIKTLNEQEQIIKNEKRVAIRMLKTLEGKEVSTQNIEAFNKDFGDEDIIVGQSIRGKNFDEFRFLRAGEAVTAFYDADAQLIGTTTEKSFWDLPLKTEAYINNTYPDYAAKEVILFDDNEQNESDMVLYGQQFAEKDNYFVTLVKDNQAIIIRVNMAGEVYPFSKFR